VLEEEAKPLLANAPDALTAGDLEALSRMLAKVDNVPEGLSDESAQVLDALAEKIQQHLDDYESVAASKAQEAFDEFWDKYEPLIKDKKFDEAVKLCESAFVFPPSSGREGEEEPPEGGTPTAGVTASAGPLQNPPEGGTPTAGVTASAGSVKHLTDESGRTAPSATSLSRSLRADAALLKSFFDSMATNLPSLVGKTIPVGRIAIKAREVKDGQLMLSGSGAEMAWDADRLDSETLIELGLKSVNDEAKKARLSALHAFYFGLPRRARRRQATTPAGSKANAIRSSG